MRSWAILPIVVLSVFTCVCEAGKNTDLIEQGKVELSRTDARELLSGSLFFFYRNFGDPRLEPLARAVWELDQTQFPGLSWDLLGQPSYRIDFAQMWAQWLRNFRKNEKELQEVRSYVDAFVVSGNTELRASAINFIGSLGGEPDVPLLKKIALEDERSVALNAVIALEKIGGNAARTALLDLEKTVKDRFLRERIRTINSNK
jgi:hypothetical protein